MPDGSVKLVSDVLQSNKFQLVALITRRRLITVVLGRRRHLVNGKRTSRVINNVRRSWAVLGSTRL